MLPVDKTLECIRLSVTNAPTFQRFFVPTFTNLFLTRPFITSAKGRCNARRLSVVSVCLSVRIFTKILPQMYLCTRKNLLNFGSNPESGSGVRIRIRLQTPDPDHILVGGRVRSVTAPCYIVQRWCYAWGQVTWGTTSLFHNLMTVPERAGAAVACWRLAGFMMTIDGMWRPAAARGQHCWSVRVDCISSASRVIAVLGHRGFTTALAQPSICLCVCLT